MPVECNAVRMERAQSTKVRGIIGKGGARSSRTGACAGKVRQAAHLRGTLLKSPLCREASAWRHLERQPSDETGGGLVGFRAQSRSFLLYMTCRF